MGSNWQSLDFARNQNYHGPLGAFTVVWAWRKTQVKCRTARENCGRICFPFVFACAVGKNPKTPIWAPWVTTPLHGQVNGAWDLPYISVGHFLTNKRIQHLHNSCTNYTSWLVGGPPIENLCYNPTNKSCIVIQYIPSHLVRDPFVGPSLHISIPTHGLLIYRKTMFEISFFIICLWCYCCCFFEISAEAGDPTKLIII